MKLYGYEDQSSSLKKLKEVTIQAEPNMLRKIAKFISDAANLMERQAEKFDHCHLQDSVDTPPEGVDIVIASINAGNRQKTAQNSPPREP